MIDDIERLKKDNKELQNEVDYYKHEYYSECDLREKLEKALDKAIKKITLDNDEGFEFLDSQYEYWKEWCLKDVE